MPYIKLLTALAGLALLTACGGASPTATGDPSQTTDCAANPFGASCIAEDIALPARITDCITAGNAGDAKCASLTSDTAMNTAINTCLTNPFDDTCTASGFTFSTYADMARKNRASFCGISGNAGNTLCTALTTCQTNPFGATCGAYFESAKNPYCETNPTATSCVNTTVWLASFTGGEALTTTPNATTRKNEFLQGTATGFASGANAGIRQTFGSPTTDIPVETLTFASADTATGGMAFFGGELYSGEAGSETGTGNDFYYAGILDGTNLGAPITETITAEANVRWTGQIRAVASSNTAELFAGTITDFGVNITFDGTEGTIKSAFATNPQFVYEIDGDFDENGIITGDVDFGAGDATNGINPTQFRSSYSPGTLRGIIGQNGAVGVFHSDNENSEAGSNVARFSGGFIAAPPDPCIALGNCPVNTATWLGSFTGGEALPTTPDTTNRKSQFLQATDAGFADGANANIRQTHSSPTEDIAIETLTFANTATATGGLAFFGGSLYNDSDESTGRYFYYAGVLAGTNLGAPITENITSARWTGQIRADANANEARLTVSQGANFELDITFDATRETKGTIEALFDVADTGTAYSIDGTFDDKGIISGDIHYGYTTGEGASKVVDPDGVFYSPGTLSGIIGLSGAVGTFISGHETFVKSSAGPRFSGGFVVTPPAPSSP